MQIHDHGTFLIALRRLDRSADFWCPALGYDRPFTQSGPYLQLVAQRRGGFELLLQQVPEASGAPRSHDSRSSEPPSSPTNRSWSTTGSGMCSLTPNGNEFCV